MIASIEPLSSGFALTDISDPRHQYMTELRRHFGELLYKASKSLRSQGEENILDAVQMLVCLVSRLSELIDDTVLKIRSVRTYMLDYGDSRDK